MKKIKNVLPVVAVALIIAVAYVGVKIAEPTPESDQAKKVVDTYTPDLNSTAVNDANKVEHPEAVYNGDWTDIASVVDSYHDKSQPWTKFSTGDMGIWTEDYEHVFKVYDYDPYWLRLDGYKAAPLVEKTYSLDPASLIADYQSGKWDGEIRFSSDYCTTAELDHWHGQIVYKYDSLKQCSENKELKFVSSAAPVYMAYDNVTITADHSSSYFGNVNNDGVARTNDYVDLPVDTNLQPIDSSYSQDGTYFLTENGVSQYHKGKLIRRWFCSIAGDEAFMAIINLKNNDAYLYDGKDQFARLCEDGTVEPLMQGVINSWYNEEGTIEVVSLQDGRLSLGYHLNSDFVIKEVSDEVKAASLLIIGDVYALKNDNTVFCIDFPNWNNDWKATSTEITPEVAYANLLDLQNTSSSEKDYLTISLKQIVDRPRVTGDFTR